MDRQLLHPRPCPLPGCGACAYVDAAEAWAVVLAAVGARMTEWQREVLTAMGWLEGLQEQLERPRPSQPPWVDKPLGQQRRRR